jgi:hypothetical protein
MEWLRKISTLLVMFVPKFELGAFHALENTTKLTHMLVSLIMAKWRMRILADVKSYDTPAGLFLESTINMKLPSELSLLIYACVIVTKFT